MNALEVRSLSKRFGGVTAVDDLSFTVEPESIYSIIGPNGAGKTTVVNLLSGIYVPTAGTITMIGEPTSGQSPDRLAELGLSRTFQNLQICMNMDAISNVMIGGHIRLDPGFVSALLHLPHIRRQDAGLREEADALMGFVGLSQYRKAQASQMPYGALKRLELARALAAKPKILLLDEPAAGLNHVETEEISVLIERIAATGVTIVLVEHDMKLVMRVSTRILVLDYGRKLAEGRPEEVRADPQVVAAYLGAAA
ncbi:ABC transporter ATP-binding protein [Bradyrhizobium septentrionale]|uniref:ABC transporter ATP-binding protein n=1 Tax=Bradyrhizobium septentrionale TaxID=1404411 RepID=A0A973W5E6_9BRAD|nr:ABC transporter ATP-binding protein [Bradyrhizobium septentrionale]UGY16287.1 ABC transporter ATP-binding protein [Bradyrhizobium septentrionale]UGY24915.1 ABC transporter ATP-binding protein [Bradyrhizobium septentrionale]